MPGESSRADAQFQMFTRILDKKHQTLNSENLSKIKVKVMGKTNINKTLS